MINEYLQQLQEYSTPIIYDPENPYELWFKNKVSKKWDLHMSWNIGEFNEVKDCSRIPLAGESYNRDQKYFGKPQGWVEWKITFKRKDITETYCKNLKITISNNKKTLTNIESKVHKDINFFIQKNLSNKNMTVFSDLLGKDEWLKFKITPLDLRKEFLEVYPEVIEKGFIPFGADYYQKLYVFNINDKIPIIYITADLHNPEDLIKNFYPKIKDNAKEFVITFKDFLSMHLKGYKK